MTAPEPVPPTRPQAASRRSPRRVWLVVAGLVMAALAGWMAFGKRWTWGGWLEHARDKENRKRILEESSPDLVRQMAAALGDASISRESRIAIGGLLIEKNQRGLVEKALASGSMEERTVALEVFAPEAIFRRQYVDDAQFRVLDTMRAWLGDAARSDRESALRILPQLAPYAGALPPELLAAVRALAAPPTEPARLRYTAMASLAGYRDCDSAQAMCRTAAAETDAMAKLRSMQAVIQLYDASDDACKARIGRERIEPLIVQAMNHVGEGDVPRSVRVGALSALSRHPDWAVAHADAIRARLDSAAHEVERRQAFEVLVAARDAKTLARLAAYFHDSNAGVRSSTATSTMRASAAIASPKDPPEARLGLSRTAALALLVGYISFESETKYFEAPLRLAYSEIRQRARVWVGLPEPYRTRAGSISTVQDALHKLFQEGAVEGVTRAQVSDGLFGWVLEDAGLAAEAVEAGRKARNEFWVKAKSGDVAEARRILEAASGPAPEAWAYERGWLLSKSTAP